MTSENPRPPIPAVYRTSPLYDFYNQNLYPYINLKEGGITPYLTAFKRIIAPINPFAAQQIPDTNNVAIGMKYGERFWQPDPYPTRITKESGYPSHYNPFAHESYTPGVANKPLSAHPSFGIQFLPKHCIRTVQTFKKCLIANDDDNVKCEKEGTDILAICPAFALDAMSQNNKLKLKLNAQSDQKYRKVMQVPSYNVGRSVADVPNRVWEHGSSSYLRPDSMWADDRYADITQKEIDQAKERIKKRNAAKGYKEDHSVHIQPYDRTYEAPSTKIPLYP